jgi:hypothetical protein
MTIAFDDPFRDLRVVKQPQGINWPGENYRISALQILIQEERRRALFSIDELMDASPDGGPGGRGGVVSKRYHYFSGIEFSADDWSYRVEPAAADKPATLWITPTAEAVEKVRAALAEIDTAREAAEKAQFESEKARAERNQQQQASAATDARNAGNKGNK